MKQWVKKLIDQLDIELTSSNGKDKTTSAELSEEKATLLYLLDTYSKHLFEVETQPLRKVREKFDIYSKALVNPKDPMADKVLFEIRQFFNSYRIDEYSYIQNTFDDFKRIIWDFADQISDDIKYEKSRDNTMNKSLEGLKEAVEANDIDELRAKSREFIDFYVKYQHKKDERRSKRMTSIRKNLSSIKKQLMEANQTMRLDHLTHAYNRMSFDEHLKNHHRFFELSKNPVSLIIMDIDFFKKINDCYGHDIGDFVLVECVRTLKECFSRPEDFVARIGGEEFAIILSDYRPEEVVKKAEETLNKIRRETFVHENLEIKFTVSMGIAHLTESEATEHWLKRADEALYQSKNSGRDRLTVSTHLKLEKSA